MSDEPNEMKRTQLLVTAALATFAGTALGCLVVYAVLKVLQ